jgi:hypothetical protein
MIHYIYTLDYEVPTVTNDYETRLVLRRDVMIDRAERKKSCWLAERIPFLSRGYYERVLAVVRKDNDVDDVSSASDNSAGSY